MISEDQKNVSTNKFKFHFHMQYSNLCESMSEFSLCKFPFGSEIRHFSAAGVKNISCEQSRRWTTRALPQMPWILLVEVKPDPPGLQECAGASTPKSLCLSCVWAILARSGYEQKPVTWMKHLVPSLKVPPSHPGSFLCIMYMLFAARILGVLTQLFKIKLSQILTCCFFFIIPTFFL